MEGPSLYLAAQQLYPFVGKKIKNVEGNTQIGKERLLNKKILAIFSWGKHLVFQFDTFAMRVHFMLFGTFQATIKEVKVTGDYPAKKNPRLVITCSNGHIDLYSCSIKFIESQNAKSAYDFSADLMSSEWDAKQAYAKTINDPQREIADLILDQTVFAGAGNIIKNEVLYLEKIHPKTKVGELNKTKLKNVIKRLHSFSRQFYDWRKVFELKKHYQVYRQKKCPTCQNPITRVKTGLGQRWSFFCPHCQVEY